MGWFGHGKYDGDETESTQMAMVEVAYGKTNIPLRNGKILDESWHWKVGQECLAPEVVDWVFSKWDKVWKTCIQDRRRQEAHDLNVMMAADFFMNHGVALPDGLRQKAQHSIENLLGEHASDFNSPEKRRRVLRRFQKKLDTWPEYSEVTV